MKKFCAFIFLGLASGCLPAQEPNQIIVDGEATLEFEPDTFSLGASIRSRQQNQDAALAEIAGRLATIRETMPNLEGLTHLTIDASAAQMTPVQDAECMEARRYSSEEACPIEGYFGSISISVKGSPAKASGRALSLLSELGAESVSLSRYTLAEMGAARKQALDAAVRNARQNADDIAGAAGSTVIGPLRIQYGEGFPERDYPLMADVASPERVVVTATRVVTPETELDLDPQPIEIRAKVVAAFEIE